MNSEKKCFLWVSIFSFLFDLIQGLFLVVSLVVLAICGWPAPLTIILFVAYIIICSVRPLRIFAPYFMVFTVIAFILQLITFGFFYWYTIVFFSFIVFSFISPILQKKIMLNFANKIDDNR